AASGEVTAARRAGGRGGDVQVAVLRVAGSLMFNRMVDRVRAHTPAYVSAHGLRARQIAELRSRQPGLAALPAVRCRWVTEITGHDAHPARGAAALRAPRGGRRARAGVS